MSRKDIPDQTRSNTQSKRPWLDLDNQLSASAFDVPVQEAIASRFKSRSLKKKSARVILNPLGGYRINKYVEALSENLAANNVSTHFAGDLAELIYSKEGIVENARTPQEIQQSIIDVVARTAVIAWKAANSIHSSQAGLEPSVVLPKEAPELYTGNRGGGSKGENIVGFMDRVWGDWIKAGVLTRPDLRRLDPKADMAISNWLRREDWPSRLHIPSKSEAKAARDAAIRSDPNAEARLHALQSEAHAIARALGKY